MKWAWRKICMVWFFRWRAVVWFAVCLLNLLFNQQRQDGEAHCESYHSMRFFCVKQFFKTWRSVQ
jgi:hypothetical protein